MISERQNWIGPVKSYLKKRIYPVNFNIFRIKHENNVFKSVKMVILFYLEAIYSICIMIQNFKFLFFSYQL